MIPLFKIIFMLNSPYILGSHFLKKKKTSTLIHVLISFQMQYFQTKNFELSVNNIFPLKHFTTLIILKLCFLQARHPTATQISSILYAGSHLCHCPYSNTDIASTHLGFYDRHLYDNSMAQVFANQVWKTIGSHKCKSKTDSHS